MLCLMCSPCIRCHLCFFVLLPPLLAGCCMCVHRRSCRCGLTLCHICVFRLACLLGVRARIEALQEQNSHEICKNEGVPREKGSHAAAGKRMSRSLNVFIEHHRGCISFFPNDPSRSMSISLLTNWELVRTAHMGAKGFEWFKLSETFKD